MTTKDLKNELGSLLNTTSASYDYNPAGYENDIPDELQEPDPIFEFDHENSLDTAKRKAKAYLEKMVKQIVPERFQNNSMIKDKIEQDMEQLGQLFYQQQANNVMLKAAMDVVSKGDTQPRMFEVYTKLMQTSSSISSQITELVNQFRKYYIDSYLDLQTKDEEDTMEQEKLYLTSNDNNTVKTLENKVEDNGNRYTSTKDLIEQLHNEKKEKYKNAFMNAQKQEEAEH